MYKVISFDKKFIFVHINKTAGTSIEKALSNYGVKKLEENNKIESQKQVEIKNLY